MQLTRKRILATAMDMIERDGVETMSMPRLATALGCGLMALYSRVPSMTALLDGVAAAIASTLAAAAEPSGGWEDQIRAQASAVCQVTRVWPRCMLLAVTRQTLSPGLLREAVGGEPEATAVLRALVAYALGSALLEIHDVPGPPGGLVDAVALGPGDHDADFEFGLGLLTSGLTRQVELSRLCVPSHTDQAAGRTEVRATARAGASSPDPDCRHR